MKRSENIGWEEESVSFIYIYIYIYIYISMSSSSYLVVQEFIYPQVTYHACEDNLL
jgi:hypothetical protein